MSRAWDNWNSYLDNDGNLLHGKIRFCRKGTTDDIVIYNSDGIAIRNPEFTDMLGRTEYQVFVENADNVTAYFYRYIGAGDMTTDPEDYDPSRWAYQYSSDNIDPVKTVDLTSDTANGVGTISDLRDIDHCWVLNETDSRTEILRGAEYELCEACGAGGLTELLDRAIFDAGGEIPREYAARAAAISAELRKAERQGLF